ncbi:MAG: SDR family oxidoreductase [Hydrogenophaga sp.]|nr:SDR family oxidoreductase [Hydrogenophaga sp.]
MDLTKPVSRPLALVTGASSGIGLALATVLAREGHDLVLTARNVAALEHEALALKSRYGVAVTVVGADLSTPQGPQQLFDQVQALGLRPSVLVNNAGVGTFGPFKDAPLAPDEAMLQLNMNSLVSVTKRFLPGVIAQRGRILNLSSTAAFQPGPNMALYFASKAFVLSFSEALHAELAGKGVTVTALCPGPTRTGFQSAAGMERSALFKSPWIKTADQVAEAGYRAMKNGKRVHVPGAVNWLLARGAAFTPRPLLMGIARLLTRET